MTSVRIARLTGLCERMMAELLPSSGFVSVIDPACGSGSSFGRPFHISIRSDAGLSRQKLLQEMLNHVARIEFHPMVLSDVLTSRKLV
jgi:hypothetical protein